jgi:hypothetical protein
MSSSPDIRVRLTPEGVTEVVAALKRIQQESRAASRNAAAGINAGRVALAQFRTALGALGIVASIGGFVALGKSAFSTAQQISNAAKQTNTSVEEFSRLAFVVGRSDIEIGSFSNGLAFYQKRISEAISGNREAANAFRQIGLEARQLQSLSLSDQFRLIADRVSALARAEDKARASSDLFGRSVGVQMVRVLNQGSEAIARLEAEADRLGATLTSNTAAAIDHADEAIKKLKTTITSFSTQTLAGLSLLVLGPPDEIQQIDEQIGKLQRRRDELVRTGAESLAFSFQGAGSVIQREIAKIDEELAKARRRQRELLQLDFPAGRRPGDAKEPGGTTLVDIDTPEEIRARLEAQRDLIQQQLRLTQEGIRAAEAAQRVGFEQGLLSLRDYFARRRALIEASTAAEVAAFERQIELVQAQEIAPEDDVGRIKQAQEIQRLRAEIELRRLQTQTQIAALIDEETEKRRELTTEQIGVLNRLDELEGRRHDVFLRNLEEEARQLRELFSRVGVPTEEIEATVERLRRSSAAAFDFEEARRRGEQALAAFNRDAEQIRRDIEVGIIGQVAGEDRLIELQRQRLQVLREIAAAQLAAAEATGNTELIEQARQFNDSVAEIDTSFRAATDTMARFRTGISEGFREGLRDIGANIREVRSFEDAVKSLGDTILDTLARISADIVSKTLTRGIEDLLGIGSGIAQGEPGVGGGGGGRGGFLGSLFTFFGRLFGFNRGGLVRIQRKAAGDVITGPQLPIPGPDKVPALLQPGEFVVRRAAVVRPGALQVLRAFNAGLLSPAQLLRIPRFATGGLVGIAPHISAARDRRDREGVNIERLVIEAPTAEIGRRSAQQAAAIFARAIADANRRNN